MAAITVPATFLGTSPRKRRAFFPRAANGTLIVTDAGISWEARRTWGLSRRVGLSIERGDVEELETIKVWANLGPIARLLTISCSDGRHHTFVVSDMDAKRLLEDGTHLRDPDEEAPGTEASG